MLSADAWSQPDAEGSRTRRPGHEAEGPTRCKKLGTTSGNGCPQTFGLWFSDVRIRTLRDDVVELEVPGRYHEAWISDNFIDILRSSFREVLGRQVGVVFVHRETETDVLDEDARADSGDASLDSDEEIPTIETFLGGRPPVDKTFANFVVGPNNEFAHAASLSVADFPGKQNNPLFIYSDTGLGKTHLLHAISNRILEQDRQATVIYLTAEQFMNEMINALRYKRMVEFRERYRSRADILLIDDIQFLGGKDRTQEEFFHTFQALLGSGRQIVLTADMLPRNIKGLEERLRTRFDGGLIADIQPPDLETLLAILQMKAEALDLVVSQEVALFIVGSLRNNNIRELEGVLNMLTAKAAFYHENLNMETVRKHLQAFLKVEKKNVDPEQIIQAVARFHNVKALDLRGSSRINRLVRPRQIAIYLIREHTDLSFPDIGRIIGNRDHSTIQYACRKIKGMIQKDPNMATLVEMIEKNIGL
jgi:chromosomal replication initiator protein